jgi:hypothetical protein
MKRPIQIVGIGGATSSEIDLRGTSLLTLRSIAHALRGWPTPLGVEINGTDAVCGADCQVVGFARQVQ